MATSAAFTALIVGPRLLALRIVNAGRRITVSASEESVRTQETEASPRDVPGTAVVRDAVDQNAHAIRAAGRPQVGLARSIDGRAAAELTAEPIAEEPH